MPADSCVVAFPVGDNYRQRRAEQNSSNRNPTSYGSMRGSLAAQGNRIDDTSLIREAQQGNRAAFEVLVRHYDQSVLRLALDLTGSESDAQDVYQEAFLKAYKNLGNLPIRVLFLYVDLPDRYQPLPRSPTGKSVRKEHAPVAR